MSVVYPEDAKVIMVKPCVELGCKVSVRLLNWHMKEGGCDLERVEEDISLSLLSA